MKSAVLPKLSNRVELRLAIIVAFALFIAQLGALAHTYSHDAAVSSSTGWQTDAASHDPCKDCLAYSPLLAPGGVSVVIPLLAPPGRSLAPQQAVRSLVDHSLTLAFRSRAPPSTR